MPSPKKDIGKSRETRSQSRRGGATRERILDAAEQLFAEKGFAATTMRDICSAAPAELGSISYHFSSKDEIFDIVLERRSLATCAAVDAALSAAIEAEAGLTVESILTAFAEATFSPIAASDPGWINYWRLIMQHLATETDGYLHPAISTNYLPVRARYLTSLRKLFPDVPAREIDWCFELFETSFGSMLLGFTDPAGKHSLASGAKLAQLRRNLVPFCVAGFHRIEALYKTQPDQAVTRIAPKRARRAKSGK